MEKRCGFTLLELLIVVVIVGILAVTTIPNMKRSVERTRSRSAQYNLLAIYNAEKRYKLRNNEYYTGASIKSAINSNLSLNIQDSYFTYNISASGTGEFVATATRLDANSICAGKKMYLSSDDSNITKECTAW